MSQFKRVLGKLLIAGSDLSACWLWTGAVGSAGYGQLKVQAPNGVRRTRSVHTWLYERLVGKLDAGLEPDHVVCQRPLCCNPLHLEPVTRKENCQRREKTNKYKRRASYRKATSEGAKRMWMFRKSLTPSRKYSVMSGIADGLHNT